MGDLREERWLERLPAGPGTADIGDSWAAEDVAGDSEMLLLWLRSVWHLEAMGRWKRQIKKMTDDEDKNEDEMKSAGDDDERVGNEIK